MDRKIYNMPDNLPNWFTLPNGYNLFPEINLPPVLPADDISCPFCFISRDRQVIEGMDCVTIDDFFIEKPNLTENHTRVFWIKRLRELGYTSYEETLGSDYDQLFHQVYGITLEDLGARLYVAEDEEYYTDLQLEWDNPPMPDDPGSKSRLMMETPVSYTGNYALLEN